MEMYTKLLTLGLCRQCTRRLGSTRPRPRSPGSTRKDPYYEEKLPVYEFAQVNRLKNRLYVFGTAHHGAIGLENLIKPKDPGQTRHFFMWQPVRHQFAEWHELRDAVAGHGFSLFYIKPRVKNGPFIFGCGKNEYSQIGYQGPRPGAPLETVLSVVPLPFTGEGRKVLALGAGKGHSLISIAGEGLYTFGDNSVGQCGRKVIDGEMYFGSKYIQLHTKFKDDPVVSVASRFDLSICVTQSGKVYTCGSNEKGQLGRGKVVVKPWDFQLVEGDLAGEKIVKVATSGSSAIAVSENGELFSWGCNECGQAYPSEYGDIIFHPKLVKLPAGIQKVVDVSMGDYYAMLLNQQGNVYVWGQGPCLGMGPSQMLIKTPTLMPPPLFGVNQFSSDVKVVSIASTFFYSAAINSTGDLYTWGKSINGCLGLGKTKHQYFPLRVGLGASAKKVSLGIDHTLVLGRGF